MVWPSADWLAHTHVDAVLRRHAVPVARSAERLVGRDAADWPHRRPEHRRLNRLETRRKYDRLEFQAGHRVRRQGQRSVSTASADTVIAAAPARLQRLDESSSGSDWGRQEAVWVLD